MLKLNKTDVDVRDLLFPSRYYQVAIDYQPTVGRPTFDGKNESEVIGKLQDAFSLGSTVKEACFYAGISTDSYYRYCQKNIRFHDRIKLLQSKPILMARMTIAKAIAEGDIKTAVWFLERKRPEEFSPRACEQYQLQEKTKRIEYLEHLLRKNNIDFDY